MPIQGIVFTLMTVRLAMRSSKSLMTTVRTERGGFPIAWQVPTATTTTDLAPTTLATDETNEMQLKSAGAAGVIYELESGKEVDERTSSQAWK